MSAAPKFSPNQTPPTLHLVQTAHATDLPPASIGKRLGASFIDVFLATTASQLGASFIVALITTPSPTNTWSIAMAINILYWVGLPLLMDATPGKRIIGLRVVREDYNPDISMGQLFLRETIGKSLSGLLLFAGFIMIFFNKDRQGLHDKMTKTRVVDFRA